ncbi:2-oxo-4-hydroxy-4-carboxy-5-ureidoimidazoline decarboxylase [Streptomyces sp. BBFR102]|uniref:2-oxo-4-hydroxy-4-carboxy-5-ureidoimidazoline decarboxylase n=1 Tax=Streptomyces sp. BBFR102 TaxID=3448171 RepID=UPI003F5308EF
MAALSPPLHEERTLPAEPGRSTHAPAVPGYPTVPPGLARLNSDPADRAVVALLTCCASPAWAERLAAHRPYPDASALLAASDEALYDLPPGARREALTGEAGRSAAPPSGYSAADTALAHAQTAYAAKFRFPFVVCLDGASPAHALNQRLTSIHARLDHDEERELALATEELRRLVRGRLARLATGAMRPSGALPAPGRPGPQGPYGSPEDAVCPESRDSGRPDSPYVPV